MECNCNANNNGERTKREHAGTDDIKYRCVCLLVVAYIVKSMRFTSIKSEFTVSLISIHYVIPSGPLCRRLWWTSPFSVCSPSNHISNYSNRTEQQILMTFSRTSKKMWHLWVPEATCYRLQKCEDIISQQHIQSVAHENERNMIFNRSVATITYQTVPIAQHDITHYTRACASCKELFSLSLFCTQLRRRRTTSKTPPELRVHLRTRQVQFVGIVSKQRNKME